MRHLLALLVVVLAWAIPAWTQEPLCAVDSEGAFWAFVTTFVGGSFETRGHRHEGLLDADDPCWTRHFHGVGEMDAKAQATASVQDFWALGCASVDYVLEADYTQTPVIWRGSIRRENAQDPLLLMEVSCAEHP
jgi:hypothetical protein